MSDTNGDNETHYDVVGVAPDASKDAIRAAYRARIDELLGGDSMSDDDRAETARLNAAWQVLSDPYQRERYDRSAGIEPGGDGDDDGDRDESTERDDDGVPTDGAEATATGDRGRDRRRPPGDRVSMFSAEPQPAPASWPKGLRPPPPRARVIAMVIDLAVLLAMVLAVQIGGNRIIESSYSEQTDRLDEISDELDDARDTRDDAEDRADEAQDDVRAARQADPPDEAALAAARAEKEAADDEVDAAQAAIDDLEDEESDLQGELAPAQLMLTGAILVLALLYLVPVSVVTGRTLGKQLLGIRVVNVDGTKLGVRPALLHYGAPVLFSLLLLPLLGQLVVLVVLLGVLTWPRNTNRQGLHDRLAGTLVVDG